MALTVKDFGSIVDGAKVLDGLGGLHFLDQLLLLINTPKLKIFNKPLVKKSNQTKEYNLE